jgi:glycerol uptake facilitator-like aquaporin
MPNEYSLRERVISGVDAARVSELSSDRQPSQHPLIWQSSMIEALGTGFLLIAVVGSGILGERLAGGNAAITLLANSLATAAALYVLVEWLGPLSGAHFNPLITLVFAYRGDISARVAAFYIPAQMIGAIAGVAVANAMFDVPVFSWSVRIRQGPSQLLSEFVSTFGLVGAVWVCSRLRPASVSSVVAAFIGGAFWFTATDFANPAVALARSLTNTFAGIRLTDVPEFIAAETAGAIAAVVVFKSLVPKKAGDCG